LANWPRRRQHLCPRPISSSVRFGRRFDASDHEYSRQCVALRKQFRIAQERREAEIRIGSRKLATRLRLIIRKALRGFCSALVALADCWQE